jgi:hypothetical protein
VYCRHDALVPIDQIVARPGNPKKHPPKQVEIYASVLVANGWRRPVTLSRQSGYIVRGHGAILAARRLGLAQVPVEYQDYGSEAEELADLVADNRLAELGQTDKDLLQDIFAQIGADAATGYTLEEVAALAKTVLAEPEYPITARLNERHDYLVIAVDNETDWQFLKNLAGVRTERSYKNTTLGEGRVVPFTRFLESLRENLHSITPPSRDDNDAPTGS